MPSTRSATSERPEENRQLEEKSGTLQFPLSNFYTSGSQTFLGCDPLWTTITFRDPPACNAFFKRQGYISTQVVG
ncbi:hypothetical protein T05_308 [Trichinella murrelli]|uniref:Uncharacterized protein n=1 Tax=Trichinella murrelli TaxID=144512 RepID=A0A0V0T6L8_9BILA|nr:hypothetical protein T05_308 [Trichinella murrelli]